MKFPAAVACVLFATSLMSAQTAPAAKPAETKTPAVKAAPAAKKAAPAKKAGEKEELPKIPGAVIERANGTKLGLEIVGGKFKLSFYDKKHKLMAIDVTRATARWPNTRTNTPSDFRTVLNGSGTALVGERTVTPPLVFNVFLTLLLGEGESAKAVEHYTVPVRG